MPTYDFYAHPPTTKEQVREYITTWLEPITDATPVDVNGDIYKPVSGFRRACYIHTIYQNVTTGNYVWYVAEDSVTDYAGWPTVSYSTMEQLVDAVIKQICSQWRISV